MAGAFSAQMSGQMPGVAGRHPGHVTEAPGGQAQQGGVLLGAVGGRVHQRGRHQVGHVGHHGHQAVVVARGEDEHVGAQAHDDALEPVEGLEVGGRPWASAPTPPRRRGRGRHRSGRPARSRPSGGRR